MHVCGSPRSRRIADAALLIGTFVLVADEMEASQPARPICATASVTRPPIQFSLRLPPRSFGAVSPPSAERSCIPRDPTEVGSAGSRTARDLRST